MGPRVTVDDSARMQTWVCDSKIMLFYNQYKVPVIQVQRQLLNGHSFTKYLLSTFYKQGPLLGTGV